jgi:hypothetical protein
MAQPHRTGSLRVPESFKQAGRHLDQSEWRKLYRKANQGLEYTGQKYAEVCLVPEELARKKDGPVYRYLEIRKCSNSLFFPEWNLSPSLSGEQIFAAGHEFEAH